MKFASLLTTTRNIGDEIQALAVEQHLPHVDAYVTKEMMQVPSLHMSNLNGGHRYAIVLNCYYTYTKSTTLDFSLKFKPVFFGFCLFDKSDTRWHLDEPEMLKKLCYDLADHQPIGCRDRRTQDFLFFSCGLNTFYSKCLTLTFPKRSVTQKQNIVFLVETATLPVPRSIRKLIKEWLAVEVSHIVDEIYRQNHAYKRSIAQVRLDEYRACAKLVITTRIHAAMPCLAMNIPVVYFGDPTEGRVQIIKELGVPIYKHYAEMLRRYRVLHPEINVTTVYTRVKYWLLSKMQTYVPELQFLVEKVDWHPDQTAIFKKINAEKPKMVKKLKAMLGI